MRSGRSRSSSSDSRVDQHSRGEQPREQRTDIIFYGNDLIGEAGRKRAGGEARAQGEVGLRPPPPRQGGWVKDRPPVPLQPGQRLK